MVFKPFRTQVNEQSMLKYETLSLQRSMMFLESLPNNKRKQNQSRNYLIKSSNH